MRSWPLLAMSVMLGASVAGCCSSPAPKAGKGSALPAAAGDLPVKVTSVSATLEPYNPQFANQGIPAEQVNFTVKALATSFSCTIDVVRSGRIVGTTTAEMGAPAGGSAWVTESVPVEGITGGTFAGTPSNARVACARHAPRGTVTSRPSQTVPPGAVALNRPEALALAPDGDVLISNEGSNQVLERHPDGVLAVLAGDGRSGSSGDGGPASAAELSDPRGLAVDADGTVYVADFGNDRVRAISAQGVVTTYADVQGPMALAIGPHGTLYVAGNGGVQAIGADGSITTILSQTGGLTPDAIAASPTGVLYISNFSAKDLLEYSGGVLTVIGQVQGTYVTPAGLAVSPNGDLYVGNYGSFAIDRLVGHSLSPIATFALNSVPGVKGVFRPSGVAVTPNGEVYADTDGVNGGASQPALIAIDPDGQVHLLAAGGTDSGP